jgi:hypothetical protein
MQEPEGEIGPLNRLQIELRIVIFVRSNQSFRSTIRIIDNPKGCEVWFPLDSRLTLYANETDCPTIG